MKKILGLFLVTLLALWGSGSVFATDYFPEHPSLEDVVEDVLVLRPVGLIRTVIEGAAFVVTLPVTIPLRKDEKAFDYLVRDPYGFTFKRPLGKN